MESIPTVSPTDLLSFHNKHIAPHLFPGSTANDPHAFEPTTSDETEFDDGLGYYPDGTKRTLTDEQIAMFRHSEIQKLLKAKRKKEAAKNKAATKRKYQKDHQEARKRFREEKPEEPTREAEVVSPPQAAPPVEEVAEEPDITIVENPAPARAPQGRLAASLWASQHDWSNISVRPPAQPSEPVAPTAPVQHEKSGKVFLWPSIGEE